MSLVKLLLTRFEQVFFLLNACVPESKGAEKREGLSIGKRNSLSHFVVVVCFLVFGIFVIFA